MKIGVFDSGLGGLLVLKSLVKELPEYDYIYLGDTQRVPYGNRSHETIYLFLEQAVDYLFKQNCALIIVACNTASAEALRKIQQDYLPHHYPKRRVLGMIIPTAEEALRGHQIKRIGVLATQATVNSKAYVREIKKINSRAKVFQSAAPLLVPLIESEGIKWSEPILREYLKPLLKEKVDAIILGCTHYPILKNKIRKIAKVRVISQDECIPLKVKNYLERHPEVDVRLSRNHTTKLLVTDITKSFSELSREWFGRQGKLVKIKID
jgi:glutamate racemase